MQAVTFDERLCQGCSGMLCQQAAFRFRVEIESSGDHGGVQTRNKLDTPHALQGPSAYCTYMGGRLCQREVTQPG